ncbi:hypothetical protein QFC21_002568 [Naganishia friedmannii]|uniref:Uncharacterized protein n=1 Tax=Naganishia friedmannii TaxID=89922 RepID=A0ACC2VVJ8_9TREE|nr:hypothetical protein QFC21_002568 [Naganishia friedmannii]
MDADMMEEEEEMISLKCTSGFLFSSEGEQKINQHAPSLTLNICTADNELDRSDWNADPVWVVLGTASAKITSEAPKTNHHPLASAPEVTDEPYTVELKPYIGGSPFASFQKTSRPASLRAFAQSRIPVLRQEEDEHGWVERIGYSRANASLIVDHETLFGIAAPADVQGVTDRVSRRKIDVDDSNGIVALRTIDTVCNMDTETLPYDIRDRDEFWNELDQVLDLPDSPRLEQLDSTLRLYISVLSRYHAGEHQQAITMLVKSDLFRFYSERMIGMIMTGAEDAYSGTSLLQPIEARLRLPAALLMYEVCRVQKLSAEELEGFDDLFIDRLFEMVEITRDTDEVLNYAIIRLIYPLVELTWTSDRKLALNEQFMVSAVHTTGTTIHSTTGTTTALSAPITTRADPPPRNHYRAHSNSHPPFAGSMSSYSSAAAAGYQETANKEAKEREEQSKRDNRVLSVLMRRLGHSKTFGENIIFMLNRSQDNAEDLCVQLLILKILYLLFTTHGTQEYFFTNDLQVLVDVFIRELVDLPDESEALRHTYLRVLHPLLTNTQLRENPYKHAQIRLVLLSLISNSHIKDINPTTKRLVERCLAADWGKTKERPPVEEHQDGQAERAVSGVSINVADENGTPIVNRKDFAARTLGRSQSAEDMPKLHKAHIQHLKIDTMHPNMSLTDVAGALPPSSRKHARSVTSDTGSERERGKKRSLQEHGVPQSAQSTDSSYEMSESGLSDDGSPRRLAIADAKRADSTTSSSGVTVSVSESGHSPVDRWMQFTSPESMVGSYPSLACGFVNANTENHPVLRHTGVYEANSIVGVRDQRINARLHDALPVAPVANGNLTATGATHAHKRKPPPVPTRAHKPGNISSAVSTARNSISPSPRLTPWSPEFATRKDLGNEKKDHEVPIPEINADIDDHREDGRTLGFAALAQALRDTGSKISIGQSHSSTRSNSTKKRKPQPRAVEEQVAPVYQQDGSITGLDVEEPVVVRRWDGGDQSHGWKTFA